MRSNPRSTKPPIVQGEDRSSPRYPQEAGETLVEVLVALLILAVGIVGLMGGLATAVFGSSLHRNQSDADAALVMALENVKLLPYVGCTGGSAIPPSYSATPAAGSPYASNTYSSWPTYTSAPSPAPATGYFVVTTQLWDGTSFYTPTSAKACTPATDFMQLVTITAVSPGQSAVQRTAVIKGNWS